jgi:hypothetical protein
MMYLRCFLLLVAVVLINASKKRYDGHILVSVTPSQEDHYQLLLNFEEQNIINLWNEIRRNGSVHVMIDQIKSKWLLPLFESLNMKPTLINNDIQQLFDEEERTLRAHARSGVPRGIQDTFYTYDQLVAWLQQMAATYPNLATLQSLGKTAGNRDVWLIRLNANSGLTKKTAFLDFGIHAREWIAPATGAYIINELLTKYSSGGDAKTILDTWDLHIVPLLNPDGYAYSHSNDRMWRKNRKLISGSNCYGVDLNRNFGYQWNTGGSSSSACSDTFHGGSPMSEAEAQALQRYMPGKSWTTYVTFHSYGQWWFTNWGYTTADPPSYAILKQKAQIGVNAIRSVNGRVYTIGSSAQLLYVASGGSEDWTRGTLGILYSYCLELPGTSFIVPTSEIKKTGSETYAGMVAYFKSF